MVFGGRGRWLDHLDVVGGSCGIIVQRVCARHRRVHADKKMREGERFLIFLYIAPYQTSLIIIYLSYFRCDELNAELSPEASGDLRMVSHIMVELMRKSGANYLS